MGTNEEKYKEARRKLCLFIKEQAKENSLVYEDIADQTGFKPNNVCRMLSGKYSPSTDNLIRLAESVGCDVKIVKKH